MVFAASQQKQALAQATRSEARMLGIEERRCSHMAIPELQQEIESKKQEIRAEARALGIEERKFANMEISSLQQEINKKKALISKKKK